LAEGDKVMSELNIYQKLQAMRVALQDSGLKKSGKNNFAGYEYFELQDFIPQINKMMLESKVASVLSYTSDLATLKIINTEKPEEFVEFTSPMSEANLKGTHAVQNLGAVETYIRRYLYITAFEIVENDGLDSTHNPEAPTSQPKAVSTPRVDSGIPTPSCPKCGSKEMWDNRERKTNPKAPDFKCKDPKCGGVIWPPKELPTRQIDEVCTANDEPPLPSDEEIDIEEIPF
jgi:hypothetical protein